MKGIPYRIVVNLHLLDGQQPARRILKQLYPGVKILMRRNEKDSRLILQVCTSNQLETMTFLVAEEVEGALAVRLFNIPS